MREARLGDSAGRRWRAALNGALFLLIAGTLGAGDTAAQQLPNPSGVDQLPNGQSLTPDQMRQMFGNNTGQEPSLQPQMTILEPTAPSNPKLPQSRLEQIMSQRAGVKLSQFGYEQLGIGRSVNLPQVGGVQDDYVLGPGDEIVVTMRGQDNSEHRVEVDRDGNVALPRISPIPAAGRRFGEFRAQLLASIHNAYLATEAYVAIGRLRQINVMVAGEVGSPGVRILTGLSSPLDAILVSGGIKKSGSLRNVKLIHQGRTYNIDLYGFLTSGIAPHQVPLSDGDRIVVPTLTKVVAAAGWLRRPGIYEVPPGQSAMSVGALTDLAGGLEVRGRYRLAIMRIQADGQTQLATVGSNVELIRDGEVLLALPGADQVVDRATLAGGTELAGSYSIRQGTRLSEVLKAPGALGNSPYTVFGIISRRDPRTYLRTLIAFSPIAALSGESDPVLISGDIVRVFSMRESRLLSRSVQDYEQREQFDEELKRNPFLTQTENPPSAAQIATRTTTGTTGTTGTTEAMPSTLGANASAAPQSAQAAATAATQQSSSTVGANPQVGTLPASETNPTGGPSLRSQAQSALAGAQPQTPGAAPQAEEEPPPPAPNLEEQIPTLGHTPLNTEVSKLSDLADQLDVDTTVLLNFLSDHEVTLDGAIRGPGSYVIGPGINLHDLVMVAGGTVRWADESGVELISTQVNQATGSAVTVRKNLPLNETTLSSYIIKPHDELRFRQVFADVRIGSVTLEGEVRFPGDYKIIRGERLGDLLKRAGGLTDVAYPYGTVYLRRSVAALEEDSFRRLADQIDNQLMAAMTRQNTQTKLDPTAFGSIQGFVETLRTQKGLGRISIVADPALLDARPEQNPLLETGDVIYIPQRPSTVSVLGEVMQPGSYPYRARMTANDYLERAGGYSSFADETLTYIILPDGSAQKLDRSWLPTGSQSLPPGSVIVVPRDITPFNWSDFAINASQIFSQLAVAGASLAVISTNLK